MLREADNADKSEALAELERTPCTNQAVCHVKSLCAAGYRAHVDAYEAIQQAISRAERDPSYHPELDQLRTSLIAAQPQVKRCNDNAAALARQYE